MHSETWSIQKLFQERRQYRVPFFQRPYVWNKEDQWERLWSDISEKADIRADGDKPPPHFLGAAVLEPQQKKGLLGVETLHIIDGQQRFTTLQYFLAALAIVLRDEAQDKLLSIVEGCLRNGNTNTMETPEIEVFKVWPTFRDRINYQLAMDAQSLDELRERFPDSFTQVGSLKKIGIDHPPALEAIWFFAEQISQWISQDEEEERKPGRLSAIAEAVLSDLQLVSITLGERDDAQIIFETLNGHGAQLHATDLIRNFIFMRADREGSDGFKLFETLWSPFENPFWAEKQRRGRLQNPRIEWFIQTTLQAALGDEVEIGRLYTSYRRFALEDRGVIKAEEQLNLLSAFSDEYRKLITGIGDDPIAQFGRRMAVWDASTTHAVALLIASAPLPENDQTRMYDDIRSFFVRRAICGLSTKNYNKIFLQILKKLASTELTQRSLRAALASFDGSASRWPRDDEFKRAWLTDPIYPDRLDPQRAKAILAELETGLRSAQSEEPVPGGLENLDVDHILPTTWFEFWPLADNSKVEWSEANVVTRARLTGEPLSERQLAIKRREDAKAAIGNLTLLHYGVNRSLQNREFAVKREKLFATTNLHLNRSLILLTKWDEMEIASRGQALFDIAVKLWRGP
jgi:uncharacterized protein with ParB-like and HNH nuclease domain